MMNRKLPWILLSLALTVQAAEQAPLQPLQPTAAQAEAAYASGQLLSRFHYQAIPLDDAMSAKILDNYLKALDPERIFFLKSDVEALSANRGVLDNAILERDLGIPFSMFTRYLRRAEERFAMARELLAGGFDFTRSEGYRYDRDDAPWAESEAALREIWRKRVKNDWLRLKLAGKNEAAIRQTLDKRYESALTRLQRYKSEDVFQIFMNAYAGAIEPHTSYFSPRAAEDFAISMKLSLVGIGAMLQERGDYITIRELVPGGPALRSGQLSAGDRIVAVAQGTDSAAADVLGWRVDDVVALIRGTKGTTVVLDVLPAEGGPDSQVRRVSLVRDAINLEQQAASKSVIQVGSGNAARRVGVVKLPGFYQDTEARRGKDGDFRSATRDVARLLGELKAEKVDAVLIDLRNNGGGSLDEAISLTGLFIDKGPVVQQRDAQGRIRVGKDENEGVAWDGPLGVLINRGSASASEIFAAAMQDYGRGVVIGERSYGKGTVQTLLDLDEMANSEKARFGELKMTVAQFFRVTGGSTQLRGVMPDIPLPSSADERSGEAEYDNALPWTEIQAAAFAPVAATAGLVPELQQRHAARVAGDIDFRYLKEDIAALDALRKRDEISLNEAERRREREEQEARLAAREAASAEPAAAGTVLAALRDDGLLAGERSLGAELDAEKSRKAARDVLLDESAHILGDMVELLRGDPTYTARVAPTRNEDVN